MKSSFRESLSAALSKRTNKGLSARNTSYWRRMQAKRQRGFRPVLDWLEDRLAPTANINFTAGAGGSDLTLSVAQVDGAANLQLIDNSRGDIIQSVVLNQDCDVNIAGAAGASNLLTVDFSYGSAAPAEPITVTLDSGEPASGAMDQVTIGGSGPEYHPQSFMLQTDGDIFVTGALQAVGDVSLTSIQQSTGAVVLAGVVQANASAKVTVNGSLTGDNITLAAQSTIDVDSQSAGLFGGLIDIGAVNSTATATVQVQSGSVTASGNLTLTATSNTTAALATAPAGVGSLNSDAAVSTSTVSSGASVAVSGGSLSAVSGTARIAATNDVNVTTTADGAAGGDAAGALGDTVGVAVLSGDTSARISGGEVNASEVDVSATSNRTVTTAATATQGGAAPGGQGNTQGQQTLTNYNAATPDGSVNVAGAVAVTSVNGDTTAGISGGNIISTASPLAVTASATNNPTTTADATPATGAAGTGVGAAVAIGQTSANSFAFLGGIASLTAPAVIVDGLMPASTFSVASTSGPSGAAVGVAGSLAIDVTSVNANAEVEPGSAVNVNGADLTLSAQSTTASPATALPATVAGQSVGVGASIAINAPSAGERAAVDNNGELSGANALTVSAQGNHTTTTTSLAGAAGGTATAGAVSLAIPSGATEAVVGTGTDTTLGGGLTVTTDRTSVINTQVDSASAASGVAVGGSFGLTIANESATSTVGGFVTTGAAPALVEAEGAETSSTTALARGGGAAPGSTTANTWLGNLTSFAASQGWTPGIVGVPVASTPDGLYGVAGAIAVNLAGLNVSAEVLTGASLQVSHGTATVEAMTTYADSALADGTAVNTATGVAGALAVNRSSPDAEVYIFGSVGADAVAVTATASGQTDVTANSGQGSTDVGVAGALALNIPAAASIVRVAGGLSTGSATASTSNVTVQATTTVNHDDATASGTAAGFASTGVGASVALDIPNNAAIAEMGGLVTSANQVTVSANGSYTATALAEAGASGGTATAPAVSLAVATDMTSATIAPGAVVKAGGAVLVQAVQQGNTTSRSRADSAGSRVAAGTALAFGVGLGSDDAEVDGNVTQSSALTIETDLSGASQSNATAGANGAQTVGIPINSIINNLENFARDNGWFGASLSIPTAQTVNGNMLAAAAAAINVDLTTGTATVDGSGSVTTSGALLVNTVGDVNASASADGTPTDGSTVGLGAALAINVARPNIEASIAGSASSPAVTIQTKMGGNGTYTFGATATSGAGTSGAGAAGAVAINVGACQSEASVADGATLTLGDGPLVVNAVSMTANSASALAATANPVLGIGASFAANTALNQSDADIGAAVITGATTVTVEADGTNQVTTLANAGGQDPAATGAAAIAAAFSGNQTIAEVLAGPSTLVVPALLDIVANGNSTILTTANGTTAGSEAGVGASVAVGVNREIVTAQMSRNCNVGSLQINASAQSPTTTNASASVAGGSDLGESLDDYLSQVIALVDPNAGNPVSEITVPGVGPTLTLIQNTVGLALPAVGVAATVGATASQPQTLAEIGTGATVTAGASGDVAVRTSVDTSATTTADGQVQNALADGSLALAVNFAGGNNQAEVGDNVTITAPSITVAAALSQPMILAVTADSGTGAVAAGAAGSVALNAGANTMRAQVGDGDQLTATGNVSITSTGTLDAMTIAGGQALGLGAGVGASLAASAIQDETDASIGNSQVDAGQAIEVLAEAQQNLGASAVNGSGFYLAGVAGSITVNSLVAATQAFIDVGAQLDQNVPGSAAQSIAIQAGDVTTVDGSAGVSSNPSLVNAGAAVDASAIQKNTLAYLGGHVKSGGNISVDAFSDEEAASMSSTSGLGAVTDIAGSGGIDHLDVTTKAYLDSGADVVADGSIQIAADDQSKTNGIAGSSNLAAGVTGGAAVAAGWNIKDTEAYIAGADPTHADPFNPGGTLGAAKVHADGNLPAINADNGNFDITYVTPTSGNGTVNPPLGNVASALMSVIDNPILKAIGDLVSSLLGFATVVDGPPIDPSLTQQRVAAPQTTPFQGIAVTATTRDYVAEDANGATGSFGIAPELSGAAALVAGQTSAVIAAGAQATSSQSIRVAAGSDAYNLGVAGAESAAGLVSVGAAGNLSFINNTTQAYVAGSATANDDVEILAHAEEDILAIATGLSAATGSYGVDLTASLPLIAIDNSTHAFVDAGGFVHALGNVLIAARDDSVTSSIAGEASLDTSTGLGVGASAAVTLITKDTKAFIGHNATVEADGTASDTVNAYTGAANSSVSFPLGFATETIHGLAVQASSSEQVFDVAAGGKVSDGAQIQITGSLGFYVLNSNTAAYVDTGATVTAQQVNVSAVNDVKTWDAAVNLFYAAGGLSVNGGIDVGLDRNNTTATIGGNVSATGDVEVHALSRSLVDSFVGAAGATSSGVSLAASISLISIRGNFSPILGIIPLNFLNLTSGVGTVQGKLDSVISNFSSSTGDGIAGLLDKYAQGVGGDDAAAAISSAAPTDPASTAVNGSLAGLGTQAHISGGTVNAGDQVDVTGEEIIDAHLDTSFTFNFDADAVLALTNDRGILTTGGVAGGFIDSGAQVTASGGPVIVSGDVENNQQIAASTAVNGTANQVSAVIRGVATTITPAIPKTGSDQVAVGDTTGIMVGTPLVVNAGPSDQETVTVTAVDSNSITANFAETHPAGATLTLPEQTTVKAPHGDVDLTATSHTSAKYLALLPAYDSKLQSKSADTSLASTVDAHISADAAVTGNNVNVQAKDTGAIFVLSIAMTIKRGSFGVGANLTTTEAGDNVTAYTEDSTVIATTGTIDLNATAVQNIQTYGIGSAVATGGSFVGAGSYVSTDVANTIEAYVKGGTVEAKGGVTIAAGDSDGSNQTTITSLAGGVAGTLGSVAVGAAVTNNTLENTIETYIDGAKVVSDTGDVGLNAVSDLSLTTVALALAGAAKFALGGSVTLNTDRNKVESMIQDGATATAHGSVDVTASDTPALNIVAGTLAGSTSVGVAASVAINSIGDTVQAGVDGSSVTADSGNVQVLSTYQADMTKQIVVGGGGGSTVGIAGSVDVNRIDNNVQASVTNQSTVAAYDDVTVIAQTGTALNPIVGSVSVGGSAGIGGSVLLDEFSDDTQAFISGNSTVHGSGNAPVTVPKADGTTATQSASGVFVIATTNIHVTEVTINGGVGGTVGVSGTVDVDLIGDTTRAYIDGSTVNPATDSSADNAAQAVFVRAANNTTVDVNAGTGAIAGTAAVGATSDTTLIHNLTQASIKNNAQVNARSDVEVTAYAPEAVNALLISVAGSFVAGVAGQALVISMSSDTEAYIDGSTVDVADSESGDLSVLANTNDQLGTGGSVGAIIAGAAGIGLGGGLGGSVIVATIAPTTKAYLNNASTNASRQTQVEADSFEDEKTYDITAAGGLYLGAAGSVIVTTINPDTEAYIAGTSQVNQAAPGNLSNVTVEATDTATATDLAGAAAGGIAGIGASIDVLTDRNVTEAYIGTGSTVSAGQDLQVLANETRNISSTVLAFSGGLVALQAGVSVVNVGSGMSGPGLSDSGTTQSDVDGQIQASPLSGPGGGKVSMLPNDPNGVASAAQSNANGQISGVNVDDSFSTSQPAALGTSASIQGSASAGSNITVKATDTSEIQTVSGSAGGGLVSVGAAVAISNISPNTEAYIAGTGTVSAGGTITVNAAFALNQSGRDIAQAFAGGGGFVAAGGAVIEVSDDSTQSAYIGGNAQIVQAQAVTIEAQSTRTLIAVTGQVGVGAVTVGAAVAIVNAGGSTEAYVQGAAQIGENAGQSVGSLTVTANADTTVDVTAVAVSVGGVAGSGNDAEAKIEKQTVLAYISGSARVQTTGDIDVEAISTAAAEAKATGVTLAAGGSADASLSTATITPTVAAYIGGTAKIDAGGNLTVEALHNVNANGTPIANEAQSNSSASAGAIFAGITAGSANATASASLDTYVDSNATVQAGGNITIASLANDQAESQMTGVAGGFAGVGVGLSQATTSGSASAQMEGTVTGGQTLTVTANSQDNANTSSFGLTGGVVGVGVAAADAEGSPTVIAAIDGGATVTGQVAIQAGANKTATAKTTGVTVGGIAIAGMSATANTGGPTTAQVNGGLQAGAVKVLSNDTETPAAHLTVGTVGAIAVTGDSATADGSGTAAAFIGASANLMVTGLVTVTGTSNGTSEADGGGGAAGLGTITETSVTATNEGAAAAFVAGNVTSNSLSIKANSTQGANASSNLAQIGLISGNGSTTTATVGPANGTGGLVEAFVGTEANSGPSGNPTTLNITNALTVSATSQTNAAANLSVGSGGLINGQNATANATSNDTTQAYLGNGASLGNGVVVNAGSVQVTATSTDLATGNASINGGGLGNIQHDATNASVTPTIDAYFGQYVSANVAGNVDIKATSNDAEGHATANFAGGGAIQKGSADANATDSPTVRGYIDSGSSITAGGDVTVDGSALTQGQASPDQIGSVQTSNSSITANSLTSVNTGDSVVYDYGSSTAPIQSGGSSLQDDRAFQAIALGASTVQLGSTFNAQRVNASNISNPNQSGVDPSLNVIEFSTPDTLQTGDVVQYDDMGNPQIGGLSQGNTYFVRTLTPNTIALYASTNQLASETTYSFVPSSVIFHNTRIKNPNNAFTKGEAVIYEAPPSEPELGLVGGGSLQNGHTYWVKDLLVGGYFELAATPGGKPLQLDPSTTKGQHELFPAGINLSPASGIQNLHIAFSDAGQRGDLIQPGTTPPSSGGTGLSSSSASGGSGGFVDVSEPTATTSSNPLVQAYVAAQTLNARGNVSITSEAIGNTTANANNSAGGFVAVGNISETTNFNSFSQAFVGTMNGDTVDGTGVTINAQGKFRLSSDTQLTTDVSGKAVSGGAASSTNNDATANVPSNTDSIVGENAQINAGSINLIATGSQFKVTISPRAITGALFGSATANANANINPTTEVLIDGGTTRLDGAQGVDVRALNENDMPSLNADASNYSIGPAGSSNNNSNTHLQTFVESDSGATVIAGPRPAGTPLVSPPGGFPYLALYVQAEDRNVANTHEDRTITWNGNVTLLSTSPDLVIDPNGVVTADNFVAVTDGVNGPTRTVGQTITSGTAVVTDILDHVGQICFVGGDSVENSDDSAPPTGLNYPLFTFDYAAQTVTIINQSANNLRIAKINVIDTNNAVNRASTVSDIFIDSPNYPAQQVPLGFNIAFVVQPTAVDIENQQNPAGNQASSDIDLTGSIQNPIGSTTIKNQRGKINATSTIAAVWTNAWTSWRREALEQRRSRRTRSARN